MNRIPLLVLFSLWGCQDNSKIDWKKDYAAALKEAKKSGRYVVVHFSGPDCPSCKKMDETTYADAGVIEHSNRGFVNVGIYLEAPNELSTQFGIQGIPTTFLVTSEGERLRKWEGYLGPEKYRKSLDEAVEAHRKIKDVEARLKADPDNFELNREAGGYFQTLSRYRRAADAFKKAAARAPDPDTQGRLLIRVLAQLYDLDVSDEVNTEILAVAGELEKLKADEKVGCKPEALAARAQVTMNKQKPDDAIRIFEEIVENHPGSDKAPVSLLWLADLYHHHRKDNPKAEKTLRRLIEKYPTSPLAEDAKGMLEHLKAHSDK